MNKKIIACMFGAALFLGASGAAWAELAVIAHPSLKLVGVSADDLKEIYLGRIKTFPGGADVRCVDQETDSAPRKEFAKKVLRMDEQELRSYWAKQVFTGKSKPPQTLKNDEAVKRWVSENPEGLGYVQGEFVDSSVKVLLIIP